MKPIVIALALGLTAGAATAGESAAEPALGTGELARLFAEMPPGDAENGAALHQEYWCSSCHGPSGAAQSRNYPSVAGQVESYTYKVLQDYRAHRRSEGDGRSALMVASVQKLTNQELADLAAYYASQPRPAPSGPKAKLSEATLALITKGDPQRLLTPCASCHGADGAAGVRPETPALAGLEAEYLEHTLLQYRSGARANDTAKGMRFFAQQLTEAEIKELAAYYAGLGE